MSHPSQPTTPPTKGHPSPGRPAGTLSWLEGSDKYLLSQFGYTLNAIKEFYTSICGTTLDENYENVINDFTKEWDLLHEKCGVSNTLKVHIMKHHIKDYLDMTGMPLGRRTDQTTEAAHQLMNKKLERSNLC